jgi:hypothetical protein
MLSKVASEYVAVKKNPHLSVVEGTPAAAKKSKTLNAWLSGLVARWSQVSV